MSNAGLRSARPRLRVARLLPVHRVGLDRSGGRVAEIMDGLGGGNEGVEGVGNQRRVSTECIRDGEGDQDGRAGQARGECEISFHARGYASRPREASRGWRYSAEHAVWASGMPR